MAAASEVPTVVGAVGDRTAVAVAITKQFT